MSGLDTTTWSIIIAALLGFVLRYMVDDRLMRFFGVILMTPAFGLVSRVGVLLIVPRLGWSGWVGVILVAGIIFGGVRAGTAILLALFLAVYPLFMVWGYEVGRHLVIPRLVENPGYVVAGLVGLLYLFWGLWDVYQQEYAF